MSCASRRELSYSGLTVNICQTSATVRQCRWSTLKEMKNSTNCNALAPWEQACYIISKCELHSRSCKKGLGSEACMVFVKPRKHRRCGNRPRANRKHQL